MAINYIDVTHLGSVTKLGFVYFHNIVVQLKSQKYHLMHKSILSLFLPAGIFEYFDIVDFQTNSTHQELFTKDLRIFLVEKASISEESVDASAKACGFMEAREILITQSVICW